jgi:hypothetical protein
MSSLITHLNSGKKTLQLGCGRKKMASLKYPNSKAISPLWVIAIVLFAMTAWAQSATDKCRPREGVLREARVELDITPSTVVRVFGITNEIFYGLSLSQQGIKG